MEIIDIMALIAISFFYDCLINLSKLPLLITALKAPKKALQECVRRHGMIIALLYMIHTIIESDHREDAAMNASDGIKRR